jgi:hypothetical protein
MLELAGTATAAGFRCLVVQPYDDFEELHNRPDIAPLPLPNEPLLPRSIWCSPSFTGALSPHGERVDVRWYGWRRSHLYRVRMWVEVLSRGLHLLAVDLDWRFNLGREPMLPQIYALTQQDGTAIDVFSYHDGRRERCEAMRHRERWNCRAGGALITHVRALLVSCVRCQRRAHVDSLIGRLAQNGADGPESHLWWVGAGHLQRGAAIPLDGARLLPL